MGLGAAKAQPQTHLWHDWGNKLSFSSQPPVMTNCLQRYSIAGQYYSDSTGNLVFQLFSLNKRFRDEPLGLYNAHDQPIPGGDSIIAIRAQWTGSFWNAKIILPGLKDEWYLFSIYMEYWNDLDADYYQNSIPGLYYSKIKKLGPDSFEIAERDVLAWKGDIRDIIYTPKGDGSYWIVGRSGDSVLAFEFTRQGLKQPVATIAPQHGITQPRLVQIASTFSWQGEKYLTTCVDNGEATLTVYDFDKQTGHVSNSRLLDQWYWARPSGDSVDVQINSLCFSPNDSLFYIAGYGSGWGFDTIDGRIIPYQLSEHYLYQYSLYDPIPSASKLDLVPEFKKQLYKGVNVQSITLGPDGKIYMTSPGVNVINYPNRRGVACGLSNVIPFDAGCMGWFLQPNYEYWPISFTHSRTCEGVEFTNTSDSMFTRFTWYFQTGDSTFDTLSGPTSKYAWPATGKYFVKMKAQKPSGYAAWTSDSVVYIAPPEVDFSINDSQYCRYADVEFNIQIKTDTINSNNEFLKVKLSDGFDSTFTGTIAPVFAFNHAFADTGVFHATMIYSNGFCSDTIIKDSILEIIDAPKAGFTADPLEGCTPLEVEIADNSSGLISSYLYTFGNGQSDTVAEPTVVYQTPGIFKIVQALTGPTGCISKDSALVHVMPGLTADDTVEMLRATVQPDETVLVEWQPLPNAVYYRVTKDGEELPKQQSLFLSDRSVQPENRSYTYQVAAFDSCDNSSTPSRIARTILLSGQNIENEYALLTWNAYEEWQQGVEDYTLQMRLPDSSWAYATSTLALEYQDHDFLKMEQNEMCYRIAATEKDGNSQQSYSNVACVPYLPVLFIPNAFSPNGDGHNEVWQPFALALKDYTLQVYNRWGEELFKTNDPFQGWDGGTAPEGTYLYRISAASHTGKGFVREGMVVLLR